jgi:hypothetical protein
MSSFRDEAPDYTKLSICIFEDSLKMIVWEFVGTYNNGFFYMDSGFKDSRPITVSNFIHCSVGEMHSISTMRLIPISKEFEVHDIKAKIVAKVDINQISILITRQKSSRGERKILYCFHKEEITQNIPVSEIRKFYI